MGKSKLVLLCILLIVVASLPVSGQPRLPFYHWNAGPCTYCLYGDWAAIKDTKLFQKRNQKSKVVFSVKPGDKLKAIAGVVITTKAGIGKAKEKTVLTKYHQRTGTTSDVTINRNERLYLLTYHGESAYTAWFKGQILEARFEYAKLVKLSDPSFVWWVKVKNSQGKTGWTRMAKNFYGPREF